MSSFSKLTFAALLAVGPVACADSHPNTQSGNVTWISAGRGQYVAVATPQSDVAREQANAPYALTGNRTNETRTRVVMRPGIRGEMTPTTITEPR